MLPVDGGDGMPTVTLGSGDTAALTQLAERTKSDPSANPTTGADLAAGPGAGRTKGEVDA